MNATQAISQEENWSAASGARASIRKPGARLSLAERSSLLLMADLLLVNGALALTALLWRDLPLAVLLAYFKWFITLTAVWLTLGFTLDIYDPARAASATYSLLSSGIAAVATGVIYQFIPWLAPPIDRRIAFAGLIVFMLAGVLVWRAVYALLFGQPSFQRRVLIVGQDASGRRLGAELHAAAGADRANPFRGTGYQVVGFVERLPVGENETLDPAHSLVRLLRTSGASEILVADGAEALPEFCEALLDCREMGISVAPLAAVYERLAARLPVAYAERDLSLIVSADERPAYRLYLAAKRLSDLILALIGLAVTGALAPFIALGNALLSPGPLFYRQERVGRGGRPFAAIKFRTMRPDAEGENGAVWADQDDPRVTPLGRWLRRLRLDEMPQFINVLRGEMSVVGPRPERPQLVGEISRVLPIYRARHAVRPGITGWAQVRYRYGNSMEDARVKLEYDLYYLKHAGFLLDLVILLRTIPVMLRFEGH